VTVPGAALRQTERFRPAADTVGKFPMGSVVVSFLLETSSKDQQQQIICFRLIRETVRKSLQNAKKWVEYD
jgi:hypothetical protein